MKFLDITGLTYFINKLKNREVNGKGLSTEDFTTNYKNTIESLNNTYCKKSDTSVNPTANKIPIANSNNMLQVGNGIKIPHKSLVQVNNIGWYRVCSFSLSTYGSSILLHIMRGYNYDRTESYLFAITRSYNSVSITQLAGKYDGDAHIITKIRILRTNEKVHYVDVYYNSTKTNGLLSYGIGHVLDILPSPILSNDIPEGYEVIEFETTNGFKASEFSLDNINQLLSKTNIYNFTNGYYITIDFDPTVIINDNQLYVNIDGMSYQKQTIKSALTIYVSYNTSVKNYYIHPYLLNIGVPLANMYTFVNSDNKLCIWFQQPGNWSNFNIYCKNLRNDNSNIITSIENKALPAENSVTNLQKPIISNTITGETVGFTNGNVAKFVDIPSTTDLINNGYLAETEKNLNEPYFKALAKWFQTTYTNSGIFIGQCYPNSQGVLIFYKYIVASTDIDEGLPRYCRGVYYSINGSVINFGSNLYNWWYNENVSPLGHIEKLTDTTGEFFNRTIYDNLIKRIETLEARITELEARPNIIEVSSLPSNPEYNTLYCIPE